ncbi:unnamed protein product [Boreogadus saida]
MLNRWWASTPAVNLLFEALTPPPASVLLEEMAVLVASFRGPSLRWTLSVPVHSQLSPSLSVALSEPIVPRLASVTRKDFLGSSILPGLHWVVGCGRAYAVLYWPRPVAPLDSVRSLSETLGVS